MPAEKLKVGTKIGFGVGDLGGNLFFTLISFWTLHYLTDVAGLAAASAGAALMVGKLWDALIDPLVGLISDRTKTRWGRRRPYLLFGALPLAAALILFFSAPGLDNQALLFWWALLTFSLLNTTYSFVNIPYTSLSPELTADYHERTSLNGYRFAFASVGTLLGAAIVGPILGFFPHDEKTGFVVVGILFGFLIALTSILTGVSVRERVPMAPSEQVSLIKSWVGVWKNKHFRVVLGVYTLHLLGVTFLSGMLVYFFKYALGDEAGTTFALLFLLVVAMASIPLSVVFSKRFGKVLTYQLALLILAVGSLLVAGFGTALGKPFVLAVMACAGVGLGFAYVPPFAMSADTIEVDAKASGRREEGAYYGLWNFAIKFAQAGGVAGSGLVLGWAGYIANQPQTPLALNAIAFLIGPVPAAFFLAGAGLLFRYRLNEKTYNKLVG
jgi:GPH family glycoside/pentoside/hexuronide:cation symporter